MNSLPQADLQEKEFTLIQELVRKPESTQRELSHSLGCSLGMTNILIKRLIRKGYIKVNQLTWNKTRYLLTYKGAMEKARKSYAYAVHTWTQARLITQAIQETVIDEYHDGCREAVFVAYPETQSVIRAALAEKDLPGFSSEYLESFKYVQPRHRLVFAATVEPLPAPSAGRRVVPLLDRVAMEFRFEG